MKEAKVVIPILILTLLVACLAATFTWFSSQKEVNIGGVLDIAVNHDVVLVPDGGSFLPNQRPYMGEKGYYIKKGDTYGTIYEGGDAPYEFGFNVKLKAQASTNVKLKFACKYIAVRIPVKSGKAMPTVENFAKKILEKQDPTAEELEKDGSKDANEYFSKRLSGYEKEISISTTDDHYWKKGGNGSLTEFAENETIKNYEAANPELNAEEEVMIITTDEHNNPRDKDIVFLVKEEFASKYFDLLYRKNLELTEGAEKVYRSFDETQTLSITNHEVGEDINDVNVQDFEIKVRFCTVMVQRQTQIEPNVKGEYGPCKFMHDYFQGAKFGFVFKFSLMDL